MLQADAACVRSDECFKHLHGVFPQYRWNVFKNIRSAIDNNEGGFDKFSQGACRFSASQLCSYHSN